MAVKEGGVPIEVRLAHLVKVVLIAAQPRFLDAVFPRLVLECFRQILGIEPRPNSVLDLPRNCFDGSKDTIAPQI